MGHQRVQSRLPYNRFVDRADRRATCCPTPPPVSTRTPRVATGFLRQSMINEEGGASIPSQFRMEANVRAPQIWTPSVRENPRRHDSVRAVPRSQVRSDQAGRVLPLFAFLNDTHESNIAVYSPDDQGKRSTFSGQVKENRNRVQRRYAPIGRHACGVEWQAGKNQPEWRVACPVVTDDRVLTGRRTRHSPGSGSFRPAPPTPPCVSANRAYGAARRFRSPSPWRENVGGACPDRP